MIYIFIKRMTVLRRDFFGNLLVLSEIIPIEDIGETEKNEIIMYVE